MKTIANFLPSPRGFCFGNGSLPQPDKTLGTPLGQIRRSTMRKFLLTLAFGTLTTSVQAVCDYGVDTCKQGYVWRNTFDGDHVCVSVASRSQAASDNREAVSRWTGGSFGLKTCIAGFVWREASPSDQVCVSGAVRTQTKNENAAAGSTRDAQCALAPSVRGAHMEWERAAAGPLPPKPQTVRTYISSDGTPLSTSQGPLSGIPDRMWNPGQTLRVFMSGGGSVIRSKVRSTVAEWSKYANIKFQFVDATPAEIRIDFIPGGSWSTIGRDALSVPFDFQTMNFGWLDDATDDAEIRRVVLHEFGHAIGMIHEHQSPAAGIPWDKDKVYQFFATTQNPPWTQSDVDRNIFEKYSVSSTNYSQYDPQSIMHYGYPAELTLNGVAGVRNAALSSTDKTYIQKWYPFPTSDNGTLRLAQSCHEVEFKVEYGVEDPNTVRFSIAPGATVTWWKLIEIPVEGDQYQRLQINPDWLAPPFPSDQIIEKSKLDSSRQIRFNAAGFLGIHGLLDYRWDVIQALPGGSRVNMKWVKERC